MILWRLSNHADLSGLGGMKRSGRWHNAKRPVVYLAEHPALALLESMVHFEFSSIELMPSTYKMLEVNVESESIMDADLQGHGLDDQNLTQSIGDQWLASAESLLLRVPSVLVPGSNYLLNPLHFEISRCSIKQIIEHPLDARLLSSKCYSSGTHEPDMSA
ncbi:MAG: hypothetical protein B7Y40_05690 [Gammaproteobacteria bacterium 28-57-27]|nr:MAG: hypothetical protein B7Y40_05690 [Gammaproteobacteria bacterium 28-57-27]